MASFCHDRRRRLAACAEPTAGRRGDRASQSAVTASAAYAEAAAAEAARGRTGRSPAETSVPSRLIPVGTPGVDSNHERETRRLPPGFCPIATRGGASPETSREVTGEGPIRQGQEPRPFPDNIRGLHRAEASSATRAGSSDDSERDALVRALTIEHTGSLAHSHICRGHAGSSRRPHDPGPTRSGPTHREGLVRRGRRQARAPRGRPSRDRKPRVRAPA
jgi:hypothetical protein